MVDDIRRAVRPPSMRDVERSAAELARALATRLAERGHRAWLVGGAVRDLALGRPLGDVDLATAATPDEVERAFERTLAVGKAFGTIVVHLGGGEAQVTTFRAEGDYGDGRRPDSVHYGATLEEDARRRDFTCNALYLDPLSDELRDPEGGLEDLRRGRLRCVGDAEERFDEDGLRLVRLARFAASLDLHVEPATLAAARAGAARIDGVSAERRLAELERIAAGPAPAAALRLLHATGVLERLFPAADVRDADLEAVERLGPGAGLAAVLATLLASLEAADAAGARAAVEVLRPSRELLRGVLERWEVHGRLERALAAPGALPRSELVELVGHAAWPGALTLWRSRHDPPQGDAAADRWRELLAAHASRAEPGFAPRPWLRSEDLRATGLAPGPLWAELLREAYHAQLDGRHASREAALAWLAERVSSAGRSAAARGSAESPPG